MEREVWRWIVPALKRLPRWWPRGAVYDNRSILAVLLWAALHDRAILWACQRANWPVQAWRRSLPDQSTMSRRLRDPLVLEDLARLLMILQRDLRPATKLLIVDGKPLSVSWFSGDSDAHGGWGAGHLQRGYKLHVLIDNLQRLLAWEVHPMNRAESVVARDLLTQAAQRGVLPQDAVLLGDASYDSNPLHEHAERLTVQLLAPRRKAHRSISPNYRQHPNRLMSIALTEHEPIVDRRMQLIRATVERYLGGLATVGGGLISLPAWVRRLTRVRIWTAAKLILHAARLTLRRCLVA
jgi:hypothetical protein